MIVVTEKEKNMRTGEKTKTKKETEYVSDWLNAINDWMSKNTESDSIVMTYVTRDKMRFMTHKGDTQYRLIIEWSR